MSFLGYNSAMDWIKSVLKKDAVTITSDAFPDIMLIIFRMENDELALQLTDRGEIKGFRSEVHVHGSVPAMFISLGEMTTSFPQTIPLMETALDDGLVCAGFSAHRRLAIMRHIAAADRCPA
jgi:hypothetical protein